MPTLEELLGSLGGLGRQVPQMPVNAQTPPFVPSAAPPPMAPPQPDPFAMLMALGNQQSAPEAPKTKRQQIGMAIGDFLTSIGAGLSNRGKAGQSTGAGAAMQTPFLLQQQRQQMQQQQEAQRQAQQKQKFDQMLQGINARMTQQRLGMEQQQNAQTQTNQDRAYGLQRETLEETKRRNAADIPVIPEGSAVPKPGGGFEIPAPRAPVKQTFQTRMMADPQKPKQPIMANYEPATGKYFDSDSGKELKGLKPFIAPTQGGEPSVIVNTADSEGNPIIRVLPRSQAQGREFPAAPTADARNRATALKKIGPVLDGISELSEKINTGAGIVAKAAGEVAKAKAKLNYDDDVAEYNALISGFTPMVARGVGHTGVLTQQDVDSVRDMFPKPGDSKTLRDRKIQRIKTILDAQSASASPDSGGASVEEAMRILNSEQ